MKLIQVINTSLAQTAHMNNSPVITKQRNQEVI